jgi:tRNA threonylcarbamoyl adenosine modification protein YjeE
MYFFIPNHSAMLALGGYVASCIRVGDVVLLEGDLGAGKTTLAQGIIHALAGSDWQVTSPTFTLLQTYPITLADGAACECWHYDLYRIEQPEELSELALDEAESQHVTLIEWPERLANIPTAAIRIQLSFNPQGEGRHVDITLPPAKYTHWRGDHLVTTPSTRSQAIDAFLARHGFGGSKRRLLAGDASFRRYERLDHHGQSLVLMDAPPPWEKVDSFLSVTDYLHQVGCSVPHILAADIKEGFLVLEDLGDGLFTRLLERDKSQEKDFYHSAIDALLQLQKAPLPPTLPHYDEAVYLREVALFAEWFLPQIHAREVITLLRETWLNLWVEVLRAAGLRQSVMVHRDYHADNLLWLPKRHGQARVGMIDYQDALVGDPAYDLVSLLEDARRDVSAETMAESYAHFLSHCADENEVDFARRYAVLGAQRNAKIIGIFTRLAVRDNKPQYLDYMPRVWAHFMEDLAHPALVSIRTFVEREVPIEWRGKFRADPARGGWLSS